MSSAKRVPDHCTIPLESGQRARWEAAANRKAEGAPQELPDWMGPILDAAADYERAVGRSAAELLRLMVPVPLRPLLRHPPPSPRVSPGILIPTVGATAGLPAPVVPPLFAAEPAATEEPPADGLSHVPRASSA